MRTRRALTTVLILAATVVLVVTMMQSSEQGSNPPSPQTSAGRTPAPPGVGTPAPEVSGQAVRGGEQRLSTLLGKVVVLGFVSTGVRSGGPAPQQSRSQLVVLRSMSTQYRSRGATTMLIDADGTGDDLHDELVNFTYDNDVPFPLLGGEDAIKAIAGFGVRAVPSVILVGRDGRIAHRWDRFVLPAELAAALEQLCDPA